MKDLALIILFVLLLGAILFGVQCVFELTFHDIPRATRMGGIAAGLACSPLWKILHRSRP